MFKKKSLRFRKIFQWIWDIAITLIGVSIAAVGFNLFLQPFAISPGGFTGIAMIVHEFLPISVGLIVFIINVPLFLFAYREFGKKSLILSLVGMASFSIVLDLIQLPELVTGNGAEIVAAVFGGILFGLGIGLVLRVGASTGGSELLANILNQHIQFSVGFITLIIDCLVVLVTMLVTKNVMIGLYSIITIYVYTKVVDLIVEGPKATRAYYVVTEKPEAMADAIMQGIQRGVTMIPATGMYTKTEKFVLFCIVTRYQSAVLKKIVNQNDKHAFTYAVPASEVWGEGFKKLTPKKGNEHER